MLYPGYELYRGEVGDGRVVGVRPLGPHGVDQDLAQVEQHGHLSEKSPCRWQQQRCRYIYSSIVTTQSLMRAESYPANDIITRDTVIYTN